MSLKEKLAKAGRAVVHTDLADVGHSLARPVAAGRGKVAATRQSYQDAKQVIQIARQMKDFQNSLNVIDVEEKELV